jgi:hypothetical protein
VVVNAVRETLPFPATGALTLDRAYYVSGDNQTDAATLGGRADLIKMLEDAVNAHSEAPALDVGFADAQGLLQATAVKAVTIEGAHVNTDVDVSVWGLDPAGDTILGTAATEFPYRHRRGWYPGAYQSVDSLEQVRTVGGVARPISGGRGRVVVLGQGDGDRELGWEVVDAHLVREALAAADGPWSALETTWEEAIKLGLPWRFYQDANTRTSSSYTVYELGAWPDGGYPWVRTRPDLAFWDVRLQAVRRAS